MEIEKKIFVVLAGFEKTYIFIVKQYKMNDYVKADNKGRKMFQEFIYKISGVTEIEFTADPTSELDGQFFLNHKSYVFELKVRNISSTAYGDILLEKHKYNSLMEVGEYKRQVKNQVVELWYVNFYLDGIVSILNVEGVENFNWYTKYCSRSTMESKGNKEKLVSTLPISASTTYNYFI